MSPNQNRNFSDRLIRIIETGAEQLTESTVKKLQTSRRTPSYQKLPYSEVHHRLYTVYHDLGRWLWETSDQAIQAWYNELGERRYGEGIPLAEVLWALVLWALVLTKNRLDDYQQEFDRLIGHFFDRAICHTAESYEHRSSVERTSGSATTATTAH